MTPFFLALLLWAGQKDARITTYRLVPPSEDCVLVDEFWYARRTKKGNDGIFTWECGEESQPTSGKLKLPDQFPWAQTQLQTPIPAQQKEFVPAVKVIDQFSAVGVCAKGQKPDVAMYCKQPHFECPSDDEVLLPATRSGKVYCMRVKED